MGIELAISHMAFAEARSTGEAQLLVAKHRADLEQAMSEYRADAAADRGEPVNQAGDLYKALLRIQDNARPAPPAGGTGTQLDKSA